jgi:hypothetical protein
MQLHRADAERVVFALVRAGDVAIQRHRDAESQLALGAHFIPPAHAVDNGPWSSTNVWAIRADAWKRPEAVHELVDRRYREADRGDVVDLESVGHHRS